jgi:3-dehydroquinate dehydratase-2
VISGVATGVICGLGVDGYRLALQHIARVTDPDSSSGGSRR